LETGFKPVCTLIWNFASVKNHNQIALDLIEITNNKIQLIENQHDK